MNIEVFYISKPSHFRLDLIFPGNFEDNIYIPTIFIYIHIFVYSE